MKIFTLLSSLLFINVIFSQALFEKIDIVDEFGDKTGETLRNLSKGTFSNSATNNSPLRVHTILEVMPDYNLEEYKEYMTKTFNEQGYTEKAIQKQLKYAESGLKGAKNTSGTIRFDLYEYENNKASIIGVKTGVISIKTSDGKKIRASIGEYSFSDGSVTIKGYKELTKGATGIKNQIKYGFYDWSQTEIYNEIVSANSEIQVVIVFGSSTYNFTLR